MRPFFTYTLALALLLPAFAYSQCRPGSLKGTVTDSTSNERIPFANIVVKDSLGEVIAGGTSDFDGNYNINPVPVGTWTVEVSFTGYKTEIVNLISTFSNVPTLLDAKLKETHELLEAVVIYCDAPFIKRTCCMSTVCCETFSCCFHQNSSPIKEKTDINVYPNPTASNITVETTDTLEQLLVFDMQGMLLQTKTPSAFLKTEINLSSLPAGMYIVKGINKEQDYTQKVLLTK